MIEDKRCRAFLKNLGARLRDMRLERGWTLEKTEQEGWPSWRHLQKIENGKNITVATLYNLAKLYDVHPSDILRGIS